MLLQTLYDKVEIHPPEKNNLCKISPAPCGDFHLFGRQAVCEQIWTIFTIIKAVNPVPTAGTCHRPPIAIP